MKTITLDEAFKLSPPRLRVSPCEKVIETDDALKMNLSVCKMNPCGSFTNAENGINAALLAHCFNHFQEMRQLIEDCEEQLAHLECELDRFAGTSGIRARIMVTLNKVNTLQIPH